MNENNDISCVIYINKRMSTNVVCFVFFTPSDVLFLQYIRFIYVSICGSIRHICRCCNTDGVEVRCKSHKKSGINTGPREHSKLF